MTQTLHIEGGATSDHKFTRASLDMAKQHIHALRALLAATEVGDGVFGFHVQQAAEKSLKAWLALLGVKFPLTHDLGALVGLLQEEVGATAFLPLTVYTPFNIQYRHQAAEGDTPIDRPDALRQAQALWQHVSHEFERVGPRDATPPT